MNARIFKDKEAQKKFEENGFVKFQFLSADQCAALRNLYEKQLPSMVFSNGSHISVDAYSPEEKGNLKTALLNSIEPSVERYFEPVSHVHHGFIIKQAESKQSQISVHQDWTFVAENEGFNSGTLWIAVNDVPKERGGIGFVSGSHKWLNHTRYTPMELAFNPINEHRELLAKHLVFEGLKAGEAVLWNHRTLHASVANSSKEDRMVVAMSLFPKEAQLKLHYQLPSAPDTVGVFDVDLEFYQRHKATDFNLVYAQNKCPEGLIPVSSYPITKARFDAEKLEAALNNSHQKPIEANDILLKDIEPTRDAKAGLWGWISKVISRKDA